MDQIQDSTKRRVWKQISEKERYEIEALVRSKLSIRKISKQLHRDRRSIQRELRRGSVQQITSEWEYYTRYCADAGERQRITNAANKGRPLKIGKCHELAAYLEEKIAKENYSPDAALGVLKKDKANQYGVSICTKTLYNYIDMDLFVGISNKDLPYKRRKGMRTHKQIRKVALNNIRGRSIEEREKAVLGREEKGHREMDCVVGKTGTNSCLLVLTERAKRAEIIRKMDGKTQENVGKELDKLEEEFGESFRRIFQTITTDNGSEFLNCQMLEKSIKAGQPPRTTMYYAHPYSSWERGSNENQNRIIRRFIPKGKDIGQYSTEEVARIEH